MKYIKLYEDINGYYQEIGYYDFRKLLGPGPGRSNCLSFNKNEISLLRSELHPDIYCYDEEPFILHIKKDLVYKLKDEWYLIRTDGVIDTVYFGKVYYKCDQLDSVIKLFKDKLLK